MSIRVGTWIGKFFVSSAVVLETSPLWLLGFSMGFFGYTMMYHMDDIVWWFWAGYFLFLAVLPSVTLLLTAVVLLLLAGGYAHFHWGWF